MRPQGRYAVFGYSIAFLLLFTLNQDYVVSFLVFPYMILEFCTFCVTFRPVELVGFVNEVVNFT